MMETPSTDKASVEGVLTTESDADSMKRGVYSTTGDRLEDVERLGSQVPVVGEAEVEAAVPSTTAAQLEIGLTKEASNGDSKLAGACASQPPGESSVSEVTTHLGGQTTGQPAAGKPRQRSRSETTITSYSELEGQLKESAHAPSCVVNRTSKDDGKGRKGTQSVSSRSGYSRKGAFHPSGLDSKRAHQGPPKVITTAGVAEGPVRPYIAPASSTAGTSTTIPQKAKQSGTTLRRGKWTVEEEAYVARVIQDFNSGFLDAPAGTTLRTYLSEKLQCDPMRITKKFTGEACIGKRVFHPAVRSPSNAVAIDKAQVNL